MKESEDIWKQEAGEAETKRSAHTGSSAPESSHWQSRMDWNPYQGGDSIRKFEELYTGKRRQDRTAWSDYFLSGIFLKSWREEAFTKLMWETVREYQQEYPPNKEFLTELYIAYGIRKVNDEFQAEHNALFPGIEYIVGIAQLGPVIRNFKKNDPAMQAGFRDYRELLMMAGSDSWEDEQLLLFGKIIDRYALSNISDRPILNADQYELSQRHPRSIRLLTYYFHHEKLPDQTYRILWNHLRLDTATNGREKLLYGELREAVLEHLPEMAEKPRISYKQLLKDFYRYGIGCSYHLCEGDTEEEREELDQFFSREDMKSALMDEAFVEEQILHYWITKGSGRYLLLKLQDYYEKHPEAPYAKRVCTQINEIKEHRCSQDMRRKELREDEESGYTWGIFDFQKRAYVRYYLNTAFHLPRGLQKPICLEEYLEKHMPYSPKWSKGLTDPEKSGLFSNHPVEIRFGGNILSISFHLRYLEYRWNDSPRVPYFPGEDLEKIEDDTQFWLLAPIAAAPFDAHLSVSSELQKRLSRLPVHEEDIPVIADCITGKICRLEEKDFPVCSLYAEKEDRLFGCDIRKDDTITLYEERKYERQPVPNGTWNVRDMDMAIRMGTRLLGELTREYDSRWSIELLPGQILVRIPYHPEKVFSGEQVTEELIQDLLRQYFDHKINRLELAYGGHSLLFIRHEKGNQYGCFWFDHRKQDWYGLVSLPEVYAVVESDEVVYVPFGLGKLPNYLVHHNTNLIHEQLAQIFAQTACKNPNPKMMMWSPQIYRFETRQRYRLALRLYGEYPADQACNQLMDRFYLPYLPVRMSYTELDGTSSGSLEVLKNKAEVQYQLSRYMQGKLNRLALTWEYEMERSEGDIYYRHLVLLQDEGRHQMIYMDDDRNHISYLVSDVTEYLDADEKRYRKEIFLGEKVPGYRVHTDLRRIRDYLDLLFSEIRNPFALINNFGEFSYEAERDYEKMKKEYL